MAGASAMAIAARSASQAPAPAPASLFGGDCALPCVRISFATRRSSGRRRSLVVAAKIREIIMPTLSSTMTEGKVVQWQKAEGAKVKKGESVVVVESDKADMDVETFYDGYLARIVVANGEVAPIGAVIALLAENEEDIAKAKSKAIGTSVPAPTPSSAPAVEAKSPATVEAPKAPEVATVPASVESERRTLVATPHARQLAKQYKADLSKITGTGPYGRIVPADVQAFAGKPVSSSTVTSLQAVGASIQESPKHDDGGLIAARSAAQVAVQVPRLDSVVPFTGMQAAVAKNMVESLSVPTFRVGYSISTTALDALYKKIKSKGVTMSALLAKAAALALVQHPVVNASCKDGKSFSYNNDINIAVAVAIDGGLITPVLQDADKIDIYSLSRKWKELVDKARAKQLQPQEYNTGTFTISNLGMFGVDRFDAILPPGQGAIMAVGASKPSVVASGSGAFSVRNLMQVNVTADHRVIYGADLATFLQTFAKIIEDPKDLTL